MPQLGPRQVLFGARMQRRRRHPHASGLGECGTQLDVTAPRDWHTAVGTNARTRAQRLWAKRACLLGFVIDRTRCRIATSRPPRRTRTTLVVSSHGIRRIDIVAHSDRTRFRRGRRRRQASQSRFRVVVDDIVVVLVVDVIGRLEIREQGRKKTKYLKKTPSAQIQYFWKRYLGHDGHDRIQLTVREDCVAVHNGEGNLAKPLRTRQKFQ